MKSARQQRAATARASHALVSLALAVAAFALVAQEKDVSTPALARFAIDESPLALTGDVRPRQYLGVLGRRAAWLGEETGESELWVHPLKLASRFQLDFRVPEYVEPIRGRDVARRLSVRPELTTLVYSHATFTVRQHILAPLQQPGLLLLLEVETYRPLEVVVSFESVLQYAWPAGLGGQYVVWDAQRKAFLLTESLKQHNALIGSPWAAAASSHPAHALPDAPSTFVIPIEPARAARELVPIAIAGGIAPLAEVAETYERMIREAPKLYADRRRHVAALRERTATLHTGEPHIDRALEWAKLNLDEQLVCNPDLGCGLVAGWGRSGQSARPGFGWFFGGDAAINSFAMTSLGMSDEVATALRFLARYQRKDGKIPHEIAQSAARIPWFSDFPYTYYHADTTPFWLVAAWRHWRATADNALLRELWPAARKAYAWCLANDSDGDGIIENTSAGLGAIEVGAIGEGIHQDVYLAAVWIEAVRAMAEMAPAMGETQLGSAAEALLRRARASLDSRYWIEAAGHHAFGILKSGGTNDTLTVWPATAAAFSLWERERGRRTLTNLASHALTSDWGARMLTTASPHYDPVHYNMGAVWPFVTGFAAWGHYNYGRPWSAFPLIDALARMSFDFARGRHPELLSGAYYRPLDEAVPQQFFATSMLVTPLASGMLGFEPDAPRRRARLAPSLAPLRRVDFARLPIGATRLSGGLGRSAQALEASFSVDGPPITLEYAPRLPVGATDVEVTIGGARRDGRVETDPRGATVRLELPLGPGGVSVAVRWRGGLEVATPLAELVPGQASGGLRILDLRHQQRRFTLVAEGLRGRTYAALLEGAGVDRLEGDAATWEDRAALRLRIRIPEGDGNTGIVTVVLHESDGSAGARPGGTR